MPVLKVAGEVADALAAGAPVVALESTVLAHGLPRPHNAVVAAELESIVRNAGAVPATIGVLDGVPVVGLSPTEIGRLCTEDGVMKLSSRELGLAAARHATGATTVAATAFLAAGAGIAVFATGGIGGVHRGAPPDVSADLTELQRTRIIVVCAGAKSILDLPATRELLESLGVLVLGWRTDEFPGFYARETSLPVDARVDDAGTVGAIWREHALLGLPGALLVCAPVPEDAALPPRQVESAIAASLARAEQRGIRGKGVTPFLLRDLAASSGGATLEANLSLLHNNVRIASEIAAAVSGRPGLSAR